MEKVETIAEVAKEMSEVLMESGLTETGAFAKEILVRPGQATIRYMIPMPYESPLRGRDAADIALSGPVLSTVHLVGRGRMLPSRLSPTKNRVARGSTPDSAGGVGN